MAEEAKTRLDKAIVSDLNGRKWPDELADEAFDFIVLEDAIEYLVDPWNFLSRIYVHLKIDGFVVASLPNVGHVDTVFNLIIRKRWPYRDRGIHDWTHLRFFASRGLPMLFSAGNIENRDINRYFRILDRPHRLNKLTKYIAIWNFLELLTHQFLVVAKHMDTLGK